MACVRRGAVHALLAARRRAGEAGTGGVSEFVSCLYRGEVTHQRLSPKRHRLRYSLFQVLFDLDELPTLSAKLRLFSHNRFNLFALHDRDHGDGGPGRLRAYVERILGQAGLFLGGGKICLMCVPRLFGFAFNPLSIYYCFGSDGLLAAVVYEVNNTFGERHSYVMPVTETNFRSIHQTCAKKFFVSPFMDMEMTYDFTLSLPGPRAATTVVGRGPDGAILISASFAGERQGLSDTALWGVLFAYPMLTLGVVAAIHWEALKLLAKGVRLRRRPPPPAADVSIVASAGSARPLQ